MKWVGLYIALTGLALYSYFDLRPFMIRTLVEDIVVSNLTVNLLLMNMTWGALAPTYLLKRYPAWLRWTLTLVGFVGILAMLKLTGTPLRLGG
ncbi:MAG: hypothetical protein QW212_00805 [Nitrososphaerales archaeon]